MNLSKDAGGSGRRVAVIGLDGTPYSFLRQEIEAGTLPHLARLATSGRLRRIESEIPTISSVAWASFMTGKNPGEHGIFGFTDRKPGTYDLYFPNYSNLRAEPIWDNLSRQGRRCCVLNVPSTYPAHPLNGVLVSGFVAPSLERAVYPAEALEYLRRSGYRIDVDAAKGRESLDLLLEDLHETLARRREAMLHFWESEPWDFFMCVFTGTDRLHHFLWRHYEREDPTYKPEFIRYYQAVDQIIGEFVEQLPGDTSFFMLSDHGFCSIKQEVYINHYLVETGFLALRGDQPRTISDLDPAKTSVYAMDPGRLYVNLAGREPEGAVNPENYERVLSAVREAVLGLQDPETGEPAIRKVLSRDELFSGPLVAQAPDLVALPYNGYDIKGMMGKATLTGQTHFTGMHTHDDAFFLSNNGPYEGVSSIRQVAGAVLDSI